MQSSLQSGETAFNLKFDGKMTGEFYRQFEDRLIDAMQRYKRLEIDLSGVSEIDLCGIRLIGLLKNVGVIVATSPVVEQASRAGPASFAAAALGCSERS
jgi:hypothetical protein